MNPEAAIEFYVKAFPSTSKGTFAGQPALRSPPATQPQTAFWHFGWHVADVRATLDRYLQQNIPLVPLYTGTGEGTGTVFVSSDTYPGSGGVLGLTRTRKEAIEIVEVK
ncbi:MAG: VOC family protein [Cyanobacteria bacterium]|nr:VOC family protein [Cyanobacteriota bacterium]